MCRHFVYYTCSQTNSLRTILSKKCRLFSEHVNKGSCTACLEKILVTFTFVILVVGITLGKNLPQF